MKTKLIGALVTAALAFTSLTAFGLTDDEKYLLNNKMGSVAKKVSLGDEIDKLEVGVDGNKALHVARFTYDVSGGADSGAIGAHGLGVNLPANAEILKSWFRVETQFVDGGAGTVALHCEDANNIYSAADITGNVDGTEVSGASDWAVGNMVDGIAAQCEITATVAGAEQTAGKLVGYAVYTAHD